MLALSSSIIDGGEFPGQKRVNPVDGAFEEVADGLGVVRSFSHVWAMATAEGLALFDTSLDAMGSMAVESVKGWNGDAVSTIVYTHGHIDHVGGAGAFVADAVARGNPAPKVVAHENVATRFDRYDLTNGYNTAINRRQFGWEGEFFSDWVRPDLTFAESHTLDLGGTSVELNHDRGETDDHCWVWVPERKAIFAGDLFIWFFPNAGNPQKVQRFAADWAGALRKMIALGPELFLPAHGLPIEGADRIAIVLDNAATALEGLVSDTLEMMNAGARLDDIIHSVRVPDHLLELPYLRPYYDEPEFVVRNLWRLYGGWYSGNPAELKPPSDASVATEIATLAGGAMSLAKRAVAVADSGDLRLACQLVEWASQADPTNGAIHEVRAEVYQRRRADEFSLMSKGIFGTAAADSTAASAPAEGTD